jgi:S1-C subfamily serine protease
MYTVDTKENLDTFGLVCPHIVNTIASIIKKNLPELKPSIPFIDGWKVYCYNKDDFMFIFLVEDYRYKDGYMETMDSKEIALLKDRLKNVVEYDFLNLYKEFGKDYYDFDKFLFVGSSLSSLTVNEFLDEIWKQVIPILAPWIDYVLVPNIYKAEKVKFDKFSQNKIQIEISTIIKNLWVLECEETSKQGTAFSLNGYGLITCEHVLGTKTKAFKPAEYRKKYKIEVLKKNSAIDLAIFKIVFEKEIDSMNVSDSSELNQLDPIAVVGFPNYRYGDTGVINIGHISGFRMVSGIRRILVNTPLIAGNSGSPVIDDKGKVIGVAVTGADKMENAHQTEHHGVIPIDALNLLN